MKPNDPLSCGHPASLLVRSVESDYCFCELCEARKERDDALKMEEHLGARVRALNTQVGILYEGLYAISTMPEQGGCDDEVGAVELWTLMRRKALEAIEESGA